MQFVSITDNRLAAGLPDVMIDVPVLSVNSVDIQDHGDNTIEKTIDADYGGTRLLQTVRCEGKGNIILNLDNLNFYWISLDIPGNHVLVDI